MSTFKFMVKALDLMITIIDNIFKFTILNLH